jgi:chemotaxis protein methyltransferase CheR
MSQLFLDSAFESAEADTASAASDGQSSPSVVDQRESLAVALVATVREPFAILSRDLHIVAANRPFRAIFQAGLTNETDFAFGDSHIAQWDLPTLEILRDVLARDCVAEDRQIDLHVPETGHRRMRLNARLARGEAGGETLLLVGLEDMTATRACEDLQAARQEEQEMLLTEVHHRVANSLQIIASLLLLKARAVQSTETREHLHDIHHRLISLATVQRQLSIARPGSEVELGPYLKTLCESLAASMVANRRTVTITTSSAGGTIKSEDAASFGLIVTELVINSLKHGFPDGRNGRIEVSFVRDEADWRLSVSDDGVGRPAVPTIRIRPGLGTSIIEALARNLDARVELGAPDRGAATTIIHSR